MPKPVTQSVMYNKKGHAIYLYDWVWLSDLKDDDTVGIVIEHLPNNEIKVAVQDLTIHDGLNTSCIELWKVPIDDVNKYNKTDKTKVGEWD